MNWVYDTEARRYNDPITGRVIPTDEIQTLLRTGERKLQRDLKKLAQQFTRGEISRITLFADATTRLKQSNIWAGAIARGGKDQMTVQRWGQVGASLKKQYAYLRNFERLVEQGKLTPAQVERRLKLYASSVSKTFYQQFIDEQKLRGGWALRSLDAAESCLDCIRYAALLWHPIEKLVPPTEKCACGQFCKCSVIFSDAKPLNKATTATQETKQTVNATLPINSDVVPQFKTSAEAQAWLSNKYPAIEFQLKGVDDKLAFEVADEFHALAQEYPDAMKEFGYFGTYTDANKSSWIQHSASQVAATIRRKRKRFNGELAHCWSSKNDAIALNPAHWNDAAKLQAILTKDATVNPDKGYSWLVGDRPRDAIRHEFGHFIDGWIKRNVGRIPSDTLRLTDKATAAELSKYAQTNRAEMFAESFVAITTQQPLKWSTYTIKQFAILQRIKAVKRFTYQDEQLLDKIVKKWTALPDNKKTELVTKQKDLIKWIESQEI